MKSFWEQRYSEEGYIYGTSPNQFFKQHIDRLSPGKLLLPADGEGRNSVYAATKGWLVDAFDFSENARKKALQLAEDKKVHINYSVAGITSFDWPRAEYDLAGLFFVHLLPDIRVFLHKKIMEALKPGGILLMEAFSKQQLPLSSGGPKNPEMLFSREMLEEDFSPFPPQLLKEESVILNEGAHHEGEARVIRLRIEKT